VHHLQLEIFCTTLLSVSVASIASGQVVPDNTLPNNSITAPGCLDCVITGGTAVGQQLFHSFEQFSVTTGGSVFFENADAIEGIFARVTGNNRSIIDGLLSANGSASLYLMNPNGILLGPNASLNIGGSFLGTTAESIQFTNAFSFSATAPAAPIPLTISSPIGLQFGRLPGPIENSAAPFNLKVMPGKTLGLIGGEILFSSGSLLSPASRVELGSVGSNETIELQVSGNTWQASYSDVQSFADIRLEADSFIDTGEIPSPGIPQNKAGDIQLQGRNISLEGGSFILASTFANEEPGLINVSASEQLTVSGVGQFSTSGIFSSVGAPPANAPINVLASGQGSDLNLSAKRLVVDDGATILNTTLGSGNAGQTQIVVQELTVENAQISASTFGEGDAGGLKIQAESIQVIGTVPEIPGFIPAFFIPSALASQVEPGANGDGGNIQISTGQLSLSDGAQILATARGRGLGGNVEIDATDFVRVSGASPIATETVGRSGIFVSAEPGALNQAGTLRLNTPELTVEDRGEISANNFGPASAGDILLDVDRLSVRSGGDIRATSFEETTGQAGNLTILAEDTIELEQGRITAETRGQGGANITIENFDVLSLQNQSLISARASKDADGGNVTLFSPQGFVLATPNQDNDIIANSEQGNGGIIDITIANAFGIRPIEQLGLDPTTLTNNRSEFNASSAFANDGTISINDLSLEPASSLAELPSDVVDASSLIDSTLCQIGNKSQFLITGRGGLPSAPGDILTAISAWEDWSLEELETPETTGAILSSVPAPSTRPAAPSDVAVSPEIAEAKHWAKTSEGSITLYAMAPAPVEAHFPQCRHLQRQLNSETNIPAHAVGAS